MISGSILIAIVGYFVLLLGVAFYTSRNADSESFFIGNRNSNWLLVAFWYDWHFVVRRNLCECAGGCG